jgi:hypothetical protein
MKHVTATIEDGTGGNEDNRETTIALALLSPSTSFTLHEAAEYPVGSDHQLQ